MILQTTFEALSSGKRLRVARLGSGPPLLCLHGYPENLQIFCELLPRLAPRFEAIAMDWPGLGQSDAWPGGATPTHLAGRLLTLLDAWGIARVTLLATDMGGQPALAFAALHPERVERLIIMNSLAFGDAETSWEIQVLRKYGANRFFLRRFPGLVFGRCERTFLPRGIELPADLRNDLWGSFARGAVRAFIVKMCAGYEGTLAKLPALYGQIACPTLVLWGADDKHFPPVQAQRLHAAIAGSTLSILPGARHWMMWYRAEEVAREILAFVEQPIGAGGSPQASTS
jgi:pimeloyl-ACP methyl ester carboxylesterase